MTMTAVSAENLPIIDITEENCAEQWTNIQNAIRSSTFIALDIVKTNYDCNFKLINIFFKLN